MEKNYCIKLKELWLKEKLLIVSDVYHSVFKSRLLQIRLNAFACGLRR